MLEILVRFIALCSLLVIFTACGKPEVKLSPKGTMELHSEIVNNLVCFKVTDRKGHQLFAADTRASNVHRWSFQWLSESSILLKSSDIGDMKWEKQTDGSWKRVDPFRKLSPNGTLVLYVSLDYRDDLKTDTLLLFLEDPADLDKNSHSALASIETDIPIKEEDLADCASWNSEDSFSIRSRSKNQEYTWTRASDGSWKRTR